MKIPGPLLSLWDRLQLPADDSPEATLGSKRADCGFTQDEIDHAPEALVVDLEDDD